MITTFFRSSSFNAHTMCENQYFIEYILGHRGKTNLSAVKGTIVHKVLELFAISKKAKQDGLTSYEDKEILGNVIVEDFDKIPIETITEQIFEYYKSHESHHAWKKGDLKECIKWVNAAVDHNDGMFDPRKRHIVEPEKHFDFEIDEEWAKYSFEHDGKILAGRLGMKGTIDLITQLDNGMFEMIDWKTGARKDWGTGEEKTYEKLCKDPQLRIYHYAVSKMFPEVKELMITIYWIKDGGPYSMYFGPKDLDDTKQMIRDKFEHIQKTKFPLLKKGWKCQKFCFFGKNTFPNPLIEHRWGQFTKIGEPMTMCQEIEYLTGLHGIDSVMKMKTKDGHQLGHYKAPGAVE